MLSHLNLKAPEVSEQEAHDAIDRFYRRAAPIHLATCVYQLNDLLQLVRYQNSAGYRVFVVDHMGKVDSRSESEYSSYAAAYKELSKLAKELNILVICCQQRNRKADEDGEDPNPKLNSLHGGGAIEQDADIVIIGRHLHKENPIPENADRYMIHLLKARNHEIKHPVVECRYNTHTQTFSGL